MLETTALIPSQRMAPGETAFITFRLHGTIPAATARELKGDLGRAHAAGTDHRRAQKAFFAKFDAVLDRAPIGPRYFESEQMADVLAGEIMMLEETGFVVHGFAILPNHAHLVLHRPRAAASPSPPPSTCCTSAPNSRAAAWCAPSCHPPPPSGKSAGLTTP